MPEQARDAAHPNPAEEVDIEGLMAALRAQIAPQEKAPPAAQAPQGLAAQPPARREMPLSPPDPEVRQALDEARAVAQRLDTDYKMGWRTPVLGHIWAKIRRIIHREVRIYTDGIIVAQGQYNTSLLRALSRLVEGLDPGVAGSPMAQLRQELEDLRYESAALGQRLAAQDLERRLAKLEQRLSTLDGELGALEVEVEPLGALRLAAQDLERRVAELTAKVEAATRLEEKGDAKE